MVNYPNDLDSDSTIIPINDNISEIGTEVINQLREAVFAIEAELGLNPSGTLSTVVDRLDTFSNPNGTIKASALTSVGLVTLPIDNAQVGSGAGILESKLALDFSTTDLNAQIQYNTGTLNSLASFSSIINSNLLSHIAGGDLADSTSARHVASQIDLNAVPQDSRDPFFIWLGLIDRSGSIRAADTVAEALLAINDDYVQHQLNTAGTGHYASGIGVDTDGFLVLPQSADTVQKAINAIDAADALIIQDHQQNLHANGVPSKSRTVLVGDADGYSYNIVPSTPARAYLVNPPAVSPVDNNTSGDYIVQFNPTNTGYVFDSQFASIQVGDVVRINYGNGIENVVHVESKRHIPGLEWIIRINAINVANSDGYQALVRVDRRNFDTNKYGVLAIAAANNDIDQGIRASVIVGDPRGAQAIGLAFDATQLDSTHYNLYLQMYPTGNPEQEIISLPAIDVTGDLGQSPGSYTIDTVVQATNDAFRAAGYNYRFIAFEYHGEFGIQLADTVSGVSFSIVSGALSGSSFIEGAYINNVVGDATDGKDALGFGENKAAVASIPYTATYASALVAVTFPTIIFKPLAKRNFVVNGRSRDTFASTVFTTDGYWDGYISNRLPVGISTVETTYYIPLDLSSAGLFPGKTILIQPAIDSSDALYNPIDYGRFIIKEAYFSACGCDSNYYTSITVVNSIHASGTPIGSTGIPALPVKLYFGQESVSFNQSNVIDPINSTDYIRYHEIYINESGETFSHERARMPVQTETVSLLDTIGFGIHEVSPKLAGYVDSSTSAFNKYVRFYVLDYNSSTGEFDGYIGSISGDSIENFGRIVRARKNVPTRFYDQSEIDYVEIKYTELDQYPGTDVLSSALPRYVDIEIFPSLSDNQENFRLAGCNLIDNRIQLIKDLREFGNVSELDFTDSCIRFIESGDRYLHQNGALQGLSFIAESESVPGKLHFNGGLALVNGHISTLSQQAVSIPQVIRRGSPDVSTLDWAVCVTDNDKLEVFPLTEVKEQVFVKQPSGSDDYYIQSITFEEAFLERKDLCIIAVANVTIASITVNSVQDARRFALNVDIPTVCTLDGYQATFKTFESMVNWANAGLIDNVKLLQCVIDEEVELTGVPYKFTIFGSKDPVYVTSETGIRVGSNVYFDAVNFVYNTVFSGLGSDIAHLDDAACILFDSSEVDVKNICVQNSVFSRTASGERAPYIMAKVRDDGYLGQVKISRNTFGVQGDDTANSAIAIYHDSSGSASTVRNLDISWNMIDGNQSILVVSDNLDNGLRLFNSNIGHNNVAQGMIGYNMTGAADGYMSLETGLNIAHNKAVYIGRAGVLGDNSDSTPSSVYGTGTVNINNNTCSYISVYSVTARGLGHFNDELTIQNNKLIPYSDSLTLQNTYWDSNPGPGLSAIGVAGVGDDLTHNISIYENKIISGNFTYERGISTSGGNVHHNLIDGFSDIGINAPSGKTIISNNTINRKTNSVTRYIEASDSGSRIYDNIFDSTTIDGSSANSISAYTYSFVERNVNHIKTQVLSFKGIIKPADAAETSVEYIYNTAATPPEYGVAGSNKIRKINSYNNNLGDHCGITVDSAGSPAADLNGKINLIDYMPHGVKLISAGFSFDANSPSWDSGTIQLKLYYAGNLTPIATSGAANNFTDETGILLLTAPQPNLVNTTSGLNPYLKIEILNADPTSTPTVVVLTNLYVTYMY